MKRLFWILGIVVFLMASVWVMPGPAKLEAPVASPVPAFFFPIVAGSNLTVSGTIMDGSANPISDVTIFDDYGNTATSDSDGNFTISVPAGSNTLTPLKPGFMFDPEEMSLNVNQQVTGANFSASVTCGDIMVNGALNSGAGGWDFPAADAWSFSTGGTDTAQFNSAPRSGRTGVLAAWTLPTGWDGSDSYGISQRYNLPSDADSVTLGFWVYRLSTDLTDNDQQYVQIRDADTNAVIADLLWGQWNAAAWTYFEYPLNAYIGRSIKIKVGSLNDDGGGVTAMYYDDVTLIVCKSGPVPAVCTNQVVNSGMELATGWLAPGGQTIPPVYTTVIMAAGLRSMQTGLPLASLNAAGFSEFYQDIAIPSGVGNATLSFYAYTTSNEAAAIASKEPGINQVWGPDVPTFDTQYGYVMTAGNVTLKQLFWWTTNNEAVWRYHEFDVTEYKGSTIRIRFGTYNNGTGGRTAMYMDDVLLLTCTGTTPAPGPGCYEAFNNRGFENNSSWVVPATVYPAGYSTIKAYAGSRSMRAGIYNTAHNRYSYSSFYQTVTIPGSSNSVDLTFRVWPKSGASLSSPSEGKVNSKLPTGVNASNLSFAPSDSDNQYVLVTDKWGNILTNGWVWSTVRNDRAWKQFTFDLEEFEGRTVRVWFGVYNNGWGNAASMFIDNASLVICDP